MGSQGECASYYERHAVDARSSGKGGLQRGMRMTEQAGGGGGIADLVGLERMRCRTMYSEETGG